MTGEITLRGRVLPIGGLKEKLLAAIRCGIKTVIIPKENKKDLTEISEEELLSKLKIVFVENAVDVLKTALISKISPIKWNENDISMNEKPIINKETGLRH